MLVIALGLSAAALCGMDKQALKARYDNKYVVALREGLAFGVCSEEPTEVILGMKIQGEKAVRVGRDNMYCNVVTAEPIRVGEVLRVIGRAVPDFENCLLIQVENVSPHAITRGVGANQHESHEVGKAELLFVMPAKHDYEGVAAITDKWFKVFSSPDEAASFSKTLGNTASGVFVKEVKLGMTFAQVESVLGVPETRVDLGEKVLYKYKIMTVEFHEGKVTNVR